MSTPSRPKRNGKPSPAKEPARKPRPKPVTDEASLPPGNWVAWDRDRKKILAVGTHFWKVMQKAFKAGEEEPHVEKTPGLSPAAARRRFTREKWESPNVIDDVRKMVPGAEDWLDTPNTLFAGERPRDLIGTDREELLRDALRSIRAGDFS